MKTPSAELTSETFHELKSPPNGLITLENGALRVARGPVSVYAWKNLGILAHMAAIGTIYSTISGVIYSVLNNYLHMSATLVATTTALVAFPRALRIFTGMLSDTVPICGYRRRPYMLLGWSLVFVACLIMAVIPIGDPYYRDATIAKINPSKLTPEQLATIDMDAPQRGIKLMVLMMIANFGTVITYSGFNGALIDLSQQEPEAFRGRAMGDAMVVYQFFAIISAFFSGLGLNTGMAAITLPFTWFCIQEDRVLTKPTISVFKFVYEPLQRRLIYRYIAFRFFYNVFSLFSVTSSSAIQSTWAGVEPVNNGIAAMLAAAVNMLGTYLIKRYGLHWNWRTVIILAQILVVVIDSIPTMLTIWNVVRNQWFWLGVPLLDEIPTAALDFVGALFLFEVDATGFEATLFGLSTSSQRVAVPFATVLTKSVNGFFDVERSFIEKDDFHIVNGFFDVERSFIEKDDFHKDHLHEIQRQGETSKMRGTLLLIVLLFALSWTFMTNILSLFTSTKCLRIAGGTGCK
ncbi:hypothetical protein LEN26_003150 [Aphanomyces euteiches]|nr:hypothetical protein AeMF1_003686 [Aphanomyces euteiches]KAH9157887.1 hypothetical protein LEN26_003150 [Aphanomyces euteiches]KAH9189729.1 hypothetical protein AeNC1_008299 [Aphanomyces euteiches]